MNYRIANNYLNNLKSKLTFLNYLHLNFLNIKRLVLISIVLIFASGIYWAIKNGSLSKNTAQSAFVSNGDPRVSLLPPRKTLLLNQEIFFPIRDQKGKEVSQIKYILESAELRDEIVVKGQKATALKGRTFLILNIKINNELGKKIEVTTRDYVRLSVNNNEAEWVAPDIHNDPVEIQAISTKFSRIGFPINDSDYNLKLRVGEINGEKTTFDLIFP